MFCAGSQEKFNNKINLDMTLHVLNGNCNIQQIKLYSSWIQMWLKRNCKYGWRLEENGSSIDLYFEDAKDGVFFKLSPEYFNYRP